MEHPDLEKKLKALIAKKKLARNAFTRKVVDTINKSEQVCLTHMSIMDTQDEATLKPKTARRKKLTESSVAVEEETEESDS